MDGKEEYVLASTHMLEDRNAWYTKTKWTCDCKYICEYTSAEKQEEI